MAAPLPQRIGFVLPRSGRDGRLAPAEMISLVQRADRLGYDSVWLGETWGEEIFTSLTWLACHTRQIKLATGITTVFSRTPAMLAQTAATLDLISGGRAILGLGVSSKAVIENWHGVPFEGGAERLKEYAAIIRLVLSGQRVNYAGRFFKLQGFTLGMEPVRRSIPIYFASITPAGIRAVGEAADGWEPLWMSAEAIPGHLETIRAAAAAAGRAPAAIEVAADLETGVSPSEEIRRQAKETLAFYLGGMGVYYHQSLRRQGFAAEADAVREAYLRRERDRAADLVTDAMVDAVALVGDAAACRRRLAQYRASGAGTAILRFLPGQTVRQLEESLEALAPGAA